MTRANATPFVFSIGLWFSVLAMHLFTAQSVAAQSNAVGSIAPVRISELGLDEQLGSAIDLVGPASTSAGRLRSLLVERLLCWIDGFAACVDADINDPRVRAFRRHLAFGEYPDDGAVTILFPDGSRIEVGIGRRPDLEAIASDDRAYLATVLLDTARAPGVPFVPSQLSALDRLAYDVTPDVESALQRLRQRLAGSVDSSYASPTSEEPSRVGVLAQEQQ